MENKEEKQKQLEKVEKVDEIKEHIKKKGISQNMYLFNTYRQAYIPSYAR